MRGEKGEQESEFGQLFMIETKEAQALRFSRAPKVGSILGQLNGLNVVYQF